MLFYAIGLGILVSLLVVAPIPTVLLVIGLAILACFYLAFELTCKVLASIVWYGAMFVWAGVSGIFHVVSALVTR